MYARVTTARNGQDQGSELAEILPQILPTLRSLDGFKGLIVALDEDGRRVVALTLWESAEALEANTPMLDQMRDAESAGRKVESLESAALRVVAFDLDQ